MCNSQIKWALPSGNAHLICEFVQLRFGSITGNVGSLEKVTSCHIYRRPDKELTKRVLLHPQFYCTASAAENLEQCHV